MKTGGVGIIVHKRIEPYAEDIEAYSDRMCRIELRGTIKTNIIGVYAPTAMMEQCDKIRVIRTTRQ